VIGSGYVGLVSGAGLADFGNQVVCVDKDAAKIAQLGQGKFSDWRSSLTPTIWGRRRACPFFRC
jgi:UDPglucose 6-dehydrogenase